jgi:hypothetical protein
MVDLQSSDETGDRTKPTDNSAIPRKTFDSAAVYKETYAQDRKQRRCRKFRNAPVWIEAAAAIALVGITWTYTHYAGKQVDELIKQYPELQKSAQAAADAAKAAAAAAETVQSRCFWPTVALGKGAVQ